MLESNITINGTTINLATLSATDLSAIHQGIVAEVKRRKRIEEINARRSSQRDFEVPSPPKIFPGMWPLPPVAAEDQQ